MHVPYVNSMSQYDIAYISYVIGSRFYAVMQICVDIL